MLPAIRQIGIALLLLALGLFAVAPFMSSYTLTADVLKKAVDHPEHFDVIAPALKNITDVHFDVRRDYIAAFQTRIDAINADFRNAEAWDKVIWTDYSFALVKYAAHGPVIQQSQWYFLVLIFLVLFGAAMHILPELRLSLPGIKNSGIFHRSISSRGLLGIVTGAILIIFYILLYWFPTYIAEWTILLDPLSRWLSGKDASQWFLYGFLYTVGMMVMGLRMAIKYRHSRYQLIRTGSVVFFQLCFAFLIPEILVRLNKPYFDFKNIWPLDYDFFFSWHLDGLIASGGLGLFMLVWGIALFVLAVPVLTYFFGKRWYCSWVCGCGGLAETVGDPFRQLSDKRLKAWKVERWLIHSVLVFAVIMTSATLYSYFTGSSRIGWVDTYDIQRTYGFLIGSAFAGVIGTGFYPLMGNRVWCRFGCPLAAYLGLVQRFKSRFRITTNGGQCISCGNCSTYCEMGIDVRWYAQRGQNIVRSSCVGCGICAAVCPRGVLKLETGPEKGRINDNPIRIGHNGVYLQKDAM
jgi:polyferredoxin